MSEYQALAILAAFAFLYSLVASRLERTPINGALVYVLVGFLCGPAALDLINLQIDRELISWLAELTLAVVLFTDSANANLKVLRRFEAIPARLLLLGLPSTILLGFGIGMLLFRDLSLFEIALLATMLAPTDAALGNAVVTNKAVPASARESLNVESGLNDGICVPVLLLFLALARGDASGPGGLELAANLALQAIGVGTIIGLALGAVGSAAIRICSQRGWTVGSWVQIPVIALSLLCFALAQWFGGSGFIASFIGGMTFGALTHSHKRALLEAAEGTGDTLAMLTWFAYGTLLFLAPFQHSQLAHPHLCRSQLDHRPNAAGFPLCCRLRAAYRHQALHGLVRAARISKHRVCRHGRRRTTSRRRHSDCHDRLDNSSQHHRTWFVG